MLGVNGPHHLLHEGVHLRIPAGKHSGCAQGIYTDCRLPCHGGGEGRSPRISMDVYAGEGT